MIGAFARLLLLLLLIPSLSRGEDLTVRVRMRSEKFLTGQGVDIFVDVPAGDRRPKLALPELRGGRMWIAEETFRPLGMTAIGGMTAGENVFTTRLRLVANSPGRLDVPPIVAAIGDRTGKGNPLRLTVENPPIAGRPPGFLGGVGEFAVTAEVAPGQVRVGQEAIYRLRIEGPGAWGMITRPPLDRLRALPIDPHVSDRPDEAIDEPPSRTFVTRIRPMKAGEVVLPPVSIATYDPRIGRYITRASNGVRLKVVDAPAYEPGDLNYRPPAPGTSIAKVIATALTVAAVLAGAGLWLLRRQLVAWFRRAFPGRARATRLFARDAARRLTAHAGTDEDLAVAILAALAEYARLGAGRPPGALTPVEAGSAVATVSGSAELGDRAARAAARCDRILFAARETGGEPGETGRLKLDARELFEALGRSGGRRRRVSGRSGW